MPEDQAYYLALNVEDNNIHRMDKELIPNCAGLCVLPQPFANRSPMGREDFYLQYLYKGEMDLWLDGKPEIMRPGDAILYYPHTPYQYAMRGEEEVQYYWLHFTGSGAADLVTRCQLPNATLMPIGISTTIMLEFQEIFREFIIRDGCFEDSAAARLTAVCVEISRRAHPGNNPTETDSRIYHALAFIHKNYAHDLTIEELASLEHLSVSRFRSLFKARTGLSPMDYVITLRMNHARRLMTQTDLAVREIAEAVGYPDQLYFSRLFKKRTGFPPSTYRRNLDTP